MIIAHGMSAAEKISVRGTRITTAKANVESITTGFATSLDAFFETEEGPAGL
jgi:hypothetical protein